MNTNQNAPGKPPSVNPPSKPLPKRKSSSVSQRGLLSVTALLISLVSLATAMGGGVVVAFDMLASAPKTDTTTSTPENTPTTTTPDDENAESGTTEEIEIMVAKLVALGLAYFIGWLVALFGIRVLGNLVMTFFVKFYSWTILIGICGLYIVIISKLYEQDFKLDRYITYLLVMVAGLVALIGLHLLIEGQRMASFSIPILIVSLVHLYVIVYHYVIDSDVKPGFIWGDAFFFLFMGLTSALMLARLGLLSPVRNIIDGMFKGSDKKFQIN